MINTILTELEKRIAEVDAHIAELSADPTSSIHDQMWARGQRDGLKDAIHAVKIVDIRSILNRTGV